MPSDVSPALPVSDRLLVDSHGVADLLSISERHVRQRDAAGNLPKPVRLGGSVRWSVPELRAWVAAGCPNRETWDVIRSEEFPRKPR